MINLQKKKQYMKSNIGTQKLIKERQKQEDDASPLKGVRFQLLKALSELNKGEKMVVSYRLPSTKLSAHESELLFKTLEQRREWENAELEKLNSEIVPGTFFAKPIGNTLLKYGWVIPLPTKHWVPNMRFYEISDEGRRAFHNAMNWWKCQNTFEKLILCLKE